MNGRLLSRLLAASLLALACKHRAQSGGQCAFHSDCDEPLVCADRYCREACVTERDCPDGRQCLPGMIAGTRVCLPPGAARLCAVEGDCPAGARCEAGRCYARCATDTDCLGGACVAGGRCATAVTVTAVTTVTDAATPTDAAASDGGACPMNCPVTCGDDGRCLTVADVAAGDGYTCARLSDGRARCWGAQTLDTQVLGDGTARPHPFPRAVLALDEVTQLVAAQHQACARRASGEVRCWGYGDGRASPVVGLGAARDLSGTGEHVCAVGADGSARCWGANDHGQLGDGTRTHASSAVRARREDGPLTDVAQIAAGVRHTCVRLVSGAVHCWGDATDGQLGPGVTGASRPHPPATPVLTGAVAIAAGEGHTCAIVEGGAVRCWGRDAEGQLGNGPGSDRSDTPVAVLNEDGTPLRGVTALALGWLHACALSGDGVVRCWGRGEQGQTASQQVIVERATVVPGIAPALALSAGPAHTCAVTRDGALWCWGRNDEGQLGDPGSVRATPDAVREFPGATQVSAGARHTCARTAAGAVWCWGADESHRLGDGGETDRGLPLQVAGLSDARAVYAGGATTCAALNDGSARCWGANDVGQVGDGMPEARPRPAAVLASPMNPLREVSSMSVGEAHVMARMSDGTLRAWGSNYFAQLGLAALDGGAPETAPLPAAVPLRDVTAVAAGTWLSCAALADGGARCWGNPPGVGSVGDGTSMGRALPTAVEGLRDAVEVGAGEAHACARSRDGAVRCWGWNDGGQVGDGTTTLALRATAVINEDGTPLTGTSEIAVGAAHACARTGATELRCWGWNQYGQLGDGGRAARSRATRVRGLDGLRGVSAGAWHTCVTREEGSLRCWGRDTEGQLGRGAASTRVLPVRVAW